MYLDRRRAVQNASWAWQQLTVGKKADQDCWAEVYVENLSSQAVWFDDLEIATGALPTALVVQETHYDPWGLELAGIGYIADPTLEDKFTYNGKEKVDDMALNWLDYGARNYDARLGRFWSVDPLAHKYAPVSPYAYVANNPLRYIDPDGRDINDPENLVAGYERHLGQQRGAEAKTQGRLERKMARRAANGKSTEKQLRNYIKSIARDRELANAQTEIQEMRNDNRVVYNVSTEADPRNGDSPIDGYVAYNQGESGRQGRHVLDVKVRTSLTGTARHSVLGHELVHGQQFRTGQIDFWRNTGNAGIIYDLSDEVAAYRRQFAVAGRAFGHVNTNFVRSLANGTYAGYPDGPFSVMTKILSLNSWQVLRGRPSIWDYKIPFVTGNPVYNDFTPPNLVNINN